MWLQILVSKWNLRCYFYEPVEVYVIHSSFNSPQALKDMLKHVFLLIQLQNWLPINILSVLNYAFITIREYFQT